MTGWSQPMPLLTQPTYYVCNDCAASVESGHWWTHDQWHQNLTLALEEASTSALTVVADKLQKIENDLAGK